MNETNQSTKNHLNRAYKVESWFFTQCVYEYRVAICQLNKLYHNPVKAIPVLNDLLISAKCIKIVEFLLGQRYLFGEWHISWTWSKSKWVMETAHFSPKKTQRCMRKKHIRHLINAYCDMNQMWSKFIRKTCRWNDWQQIVMVCVRCVCRVEFVVGPGYTHTGLRY